MRALYVYLQHTDDLSGEFTSLIFTLFKTFRKPSPLTISHGNPMIIQCKSQFCSSSFYISGTRAICCVEKYYNGRRLVFWVSVHVFYCKCIVKESSSFGILVAVSFISETTVICGLIVIIYPVWFLLFLWYFGCSVCAISWRV